MKTRLSRDSKVFRTNIQINHNMNMKHLSTSIVFRMWSHLGLNQGPPDYESDALTN